jgi:hypothetical protein
MVFIGPEVPLEIQKIRAERRKLLLGKVDQQEEEQDVGDATDQVDETKKVDLKSDSESDDDDGWVGPSLPSQNIDEVSAEQEAIDRLQRRADELPDEDRSDRANWMNLALGEQPSYNPKTLRRHDFKVDSSWTEKQSVRSKRLADEMMGLTDSSETAKRSKQSSSGEENIENSEENRQTLLEEHLSRRRGQDDLDWNKVRGTGLNNEKLNEIVTKARKMNDKFQRAT